ncbi:hypothetical protein LMF32_04715 [Desemzia sp. C1]|uniref:hypothetical protein n=1 Tax=Desemzia sp. C1 TaxID=2892016 RepID=UPI001E4B9157|nr:hypothetical protein [Desemzia sp. C1]MCI3028406.1 hypothetical protein [Desemzia sp. C1]
MKTDGSYTRTIVDAFGLLEVSRSGYYNYLKGINSRAVREEADQFWRIQIEEAYHYHGYKKGSRGIVMYFWHILGITVNLKKYNV